MKVKQAPKIATDVGDINKPEVCRKKKLTNDKEELVPSLFEEPRGVSLRERVRNYCEFRKTNMATRLKFLQRFKSAIIDFVKTTKFTDRPAHRTKYHQTNVGIASASETRNAYRLSCGTSKPDQHLANSTSRQCHEKLERLFCALGTLQCSVVI